MLLSLKYFVLLVYLRAHRLTYSLKARSKRSRPGIWSYKMCNICEDFTTYNVSCISSSPGKCLQPRDYTIVAASSGLVEAFDRKNRIRVIRVENITISQTPFVPVASMSFRSRYKIAYPLYALAVLEKPDGTTGQKVKLNRICNFMYMAEYRPACLKMHV